MAWCLLYNRKFDEIFESFFSNISEIIDHCIPLKQLSTKETRFRSKPWITAGLEFSIKTKNRLYRNYINTRSNYSHCKYKLHGNKFSSLLKLSKTNYYQDYFSKNLANSKIIWEGIRKLTRLALTSVLGPFTVYLLEFILYWHPGALMHYSGLEFHFKSSPESRG